MAYMCKYVRDHDFSPWTSPFCPPTSKVLGEPYAVRLMTCQLSQLTSSPYFGETRPTVLFFWNQRPQVWKSSYPGVSVVGRAQEGYLQGFQGGEWMDGEWQSLGTHFTHQLASFDAGPASSDQDYSIYKRDAGMTRGSMSWKHLPW